MEKGKGREERGWKRMGEERDTREGNYISVMLWRLLQYFYTVYSLP